MWRLDKIFRTLQPENDSTDYIKFKSLLSIKKINQLLEKKKEKEIIKFTLEPPPLDFGERMTQLHLGSVYIGTL